MPTPLATLTDNASAISVGFSASVSGSGGGAVTWRWQSVDGNQTIWETTNGGTGDGSTNIPTTIPGLYWAYAQTTNGPTVPQRVLVTTQLSAVATRVRASVVATMKILNLAEIGANVLAQMYPDETEMSFPCTSVHVAGLSEGNEPGLDGLDYVVYPVRIMHYDRASKTDHTPLPKYELWRQQTLRAFRTAHLPDVPECAYVKVEPLLIVDPELPQYQHFASGVLLRVTCREPRGIGA